MRAYAGGVLGLRAFHVRFLLPLFLFFPFAAPLVLNCSASTLLGRNGAGYADGPPAFARASSPATALPDPSGAVLFTDGGASKLRLLFPNGSVSSFGFSAALWGLALEPSGATYLATAPSQHRVLRVFLNGTAPAVVAKWISARGGRN